MEAGSYEARPACFLKFTIISDVNLLLLYVDNQKACPASRVSTLFQQAGIYSVVCGISVCIARRIRLVCKLLLVFYFDEHPAVRVCRALYYDFLPGFFLRLLPPGELLL